MVELFTDRKVQSKIVELNTMSQLFEKGEDSTGQTLESIGGEYAESTIKDKISKGLPYDRVTLSDTFAFYDSFAVVAGIDTFAIVYDPMKEGEDLRVRWGQNLAGLSVESIEELKATTTPLLKDNFLRYLLS